MKNIIYILVLMAVSAVSVIAVVPEPVVYMGFNENWDAQTSSGTESPLYTYKANRYPYSTEGIWGNAIRLNPRNHKDISGSIYYANNGYVDQALDNSGNGLAKFTVCGWFKAESLMNQTGISLIRRVYVDAANNTLGIRTADTFGRFKLTVNNISETNVNWFNTEKLWTFFAVTYDGTITADNVQWYRGTDDGTLHANYPVSTLNAGAMLPSGQPLIIGNGLIDGTETFDGAIDEIKIFNDVLTLEQVQEVYQASFVQNQQFALYEPIAVPQPLIYLPFDGDWENYGSAGTDKVTIKLKYDPVTGVVSPGPKFISGVKGLGVDVSYRTDSKDFENGALRYGVEGDPNSPMIGALNGLRSFTVCGWFKSQTTVNTGYMFFNRRNPADTAWNMAFVTDVYARARTIINGVFAPWTPYAYWNVLNDWSFRIVRYNADNFGAEVEFLTYHPTNGGGRIETQGGTKSLAAGVLAISNKQLQIFPGFDGVFDELYLFGSKTDASGWLANDQIATVASLVNRGNMTGSDTSAYTGNPEAYSYIQGDFDLDAAVDLNDFAILAESWLK